MKWLTLSVWMTVLWSFVVSDFVIVPVTDMKVSASTGTSTSSSASETNSASSSTSASNDTQEADEKVYDPCAEPGNSCNVGQFKWVFPSIFGNPSPLGSDRPVTLKWDYTDQVKLFPDRITIQIKTSNGKFTDLIKDIPGTDDNGNPTKSVEWQPKGYATWSGYRLVIFESASGRTAAARGGGANPIVSAEFGIYTKTTGGVLYQLPTAAHAIRAPLLWVALLAWLSLAIVW
jgi:hypothetical protein